MSQLSKPSIDIGLDFLKKVGSVSDSTNLLLSPLSVIIAYGMALEGATGETEKQIKKVLYLDKVDTQQGDISKIIKQLMEKYLKNRNSASEKDYILEFGNLLMANKDYRLLQNFVQNLQTCYSANAFNEDFTDGQNILEKVNSWVSEATRNKISNILNESPDPNAILLLMNTIYFEGKWLKPFSQDRTDDKIFNNSDGTTVKTKMMTYSGKSFNYVERLDKKLKIVEIPYVGNISMILILPTKDNNLQKVIDNLDSTELSSLIESMRKTRLDTLTIPKFKLEDNHELHKILPNMGMTFPFHMNSEFPKIIEGSLPIFISQSIQKAVIEVFEKGTTASSATIVGFKLKSFTLPSLKKIITFIADRPFMFFIRDNESGVNLFMGQLSKLTDQPFL